MIPLRETRYQFTAASAPMPKLLVLPVPLLSSFNTNRRPTGAGKDTFYDRRSIGKGVFASQTPFGRSPGAGSGPGTKSPEPSAHSGRGDPGGSLARHEGNDAGRDQGLPFQPGQATKLTQERSVPTIRGAPPLSRRAHLLTTGHRPAVVWPLASVRSSRKPHRGFLRRGRQCLKPSLPVQLAALLPASRYVPDWNIPSANCLCAALRGTSSFREKKQ